MRWVYSPTNCLVYAEPSTFSRQGFASYIVVGFTDIPNTRKGEMALVARTRCPENLSPHAVYGTKVGPGTALSTYA